MDRPDPRAREHRDRKLGDHRQIEGHAVPAADTESAERAGEAANFGVQLPVRHPERVSRLPFPQDRGLPAAFVQMAVETVFGNVEPAARKPSRVRNRSLDHRFPRGAPGELASEPLPERLRIGGRALVDRRIRRAGMRGEARWRGESAILGEKRLDANVVHGGDDRRGWSAGTMP
jgi:hypothetical protein